MKEKPEVKKVLSPKKDGKAKKHKIHKMEVEPKEGGYLTRIHHKMEAGGMAKEPEEAVHPDLDSVHDLMEEHMGQPNDGEEAAEAGGGMPAGPAPAAKV
jgi:hypothetical protein